MTEQSNPPDLSVAPTPVGAARALQEPQTKKRVVLRSTISGLIAAGTFAAFALMLVFVPATLKNGSAAGLFATVLFVLGLFATAVFCTNLAIAAILRKDPWRAWPSAYFNAPDANTPKGRPVLLLFDRSDRTVYTMGVTAAADSWLSLDNPEGTVWHCGKAGHLSVVSRPGGGRPMITFGRRQGREEFTRDALAAFGMNGQGWTDGNFLSRV